MDGAAGSGGGGGMRIVVTGGCGMIGSQVMRQLEEQGHEVAAADIRAKYGHNLLIRENCEYWTRDQEPERLYHLADRTVGIGYAGKHHGEMMTNSLLLSLHLLEEARQAAVPPRYLYVSSSCVYGDGLLDAAEYYGDVGWPESSNAGYGWAKRIGERQAIYYAAEYGMHTVIVRPSNIYGPSYDWHRPVEDMHVIPALIVKMLRGDAEIVLWGSGRQTRSFQFATDTARLMIEVMEKGKAGEAYNLGGVEVAIGDVAKVIAALTKYKGAIRCDESRPEGPARKTQDTSKLRSLLAVPHPTPLAIGIEQTIIGAKEALGI